MKTRIISILLAVCLIFGLLPVGVLAASATSGSCGKNATWSYNAATKTLSISGSGDMTDYETDPAMGIENAPPWDDYREEIEHVIINEGITSIGAEAFGFQYTSNCYSNLSSVSIAPTVTKIGSCAFTNAEKLKSIDLPNVTSIGYAAFNGTGIQSLMLPSTLETFEYEDSRGFLSCGNLQSITVDPGNQKYRSVDSVLFAGNKLLRYPAGKAGNIYTVPSGTTWIATSAFADNENITTISIPSSVSKIDSLAFEQCSKLAKITIAEGVTRVASDAFWGTALTSIVLPASVNDFTTNWGTEPDVDYLNRTFYFTGTEAPKFDTFCCNVWSGYKVVICYPENATGWDAVQQQDDVKYQVEAGVLEFKTGTPPTEPVEPTDELKPPVLQVSSNSVYEGENVILSWNQIPNASAYILKTVDSEGNESEKTLLPEKTTTSIVSLSLGIYRFSIAVRTRDRETSDFSDVVTVTVKKRTNQYAFYNNYKYSFNNHIDDVGTYDMTKRDLSSLLIGSDPVSKTLILMGYGMRTGAAKIKWGGSCEGFATTSLLFYNGKLSVPNYTNNPITQTVPQLPNSEEVISLINYYFFVQLSTSRILKKLERTLKSDAFNLNDLIQRLGDNKAVLLSYVPRRKLVGHTVVAYGPVEYSEEGYTLSGLPNTVFHNRIHLYDSNAMIYDNNIVFDEYLYYDKEGNEYHYAFSDDPKQTYYMTEIFDDVNELDFNNIEDLTPWSNKTGLSQDLPLKEALKYMVILPMSNSSAQLEQGAASLGVIDENNPNLIPIPMSNGSDESTLQAAYAIQKNGEIKLSDLSKNESFSLFNVEDGETIGTSVNVSNGKEIAYDPSGHVNISGNNMEYSVSFADNSMASGWPIIQIDGTKADNVELSRAENGMIISGDLTNAKVTGTDGITDVCGQMPRGYDEVLVKGSVETEKLYIYADKDGDSKFETLVAVYTGDHGNTSGTGDRPQTGTLPTNSISFTDVSKTDYFYDAVLWAVENGITTGTSRTRFSPYATCTRAQAVTFLWRASGSPAPKNSRMPFTDVSPSAYYYDAVLWALEEGITTGTSSTTFSPDAVIDRAQAVTFLYRANGAPSVTGRTAFTDVPQTTYYADAVKWAVDHEITTGTSAAAFSPNASCTRAQIVTFLWRCKK